jgi:RNA polymerase sigma-70 factor (ECF subfamily)
MDGQARLRHLREEDAEQRFYLELRPRVARIAGVLMGETPPVDLVHDICVDVTMAKSRFRCECRFSTWLFAIVRHHVHNWIRKERSWRELMRAAAESALRSQFHWPDEVADSFLLVNELETWFAKLTEGQRTCLVLVECECLSPREVAVRLRITPAAVRMNVHRARARLRQWLADAR